ncbi:unnamed protein product [Bubo scandiacus]
MAMGHKRGQPGETPANSQKPPPGFRSPGRSDRLPCPPRRESCSKLERWRRLLLTPLLSLSLPRWARPSGATGEPATGRGGGNRGSPPLNLFSKGSPGMRPVLPEGCGAGSREEPGPATGGGKPGRCGPPGPCAAATGPGSGGGAGPLWGRGRCWGFTLWGRTAAGPAPGSSGSAAEPTGAAERGRGPAGAPGRCGRQRGRAQRGHGRRRLPGPGRSPAAERRNPHVALITGVQQHPSPWTGMERSGQSEGEQPDQREQSPGAITHPTAPSPWRSKAGGAPWGTVDWTFLPVGATQPGEGCSWHGLAAAKLYFGWSHPSMARAAPAEPGEGSHLRSPKDARDPFASPGWGREQGRWQEVTLQIHLQPPALEGRCHAAFP